MSANISKLKEPQTNLFVSSEPMEPLTGVMSAMEDLEVLLSEMQERNPETYQYGASYKRIFTIYNTLVQSSQSMRFYQQNALFQSMASRMEKLMQYDPELKGFIIKINYGAENENRFAHLDFSVRKEAEKMLAVPIGLSFVPQLKLA